MPPLKTFIFQHKFNSLLTITIEAYDEGLALKVLRNTVITPFDYRQVK